MAFSVISWGEDGMLVYPSATTPLHVYRAPICGDVYQVVIAACAESLRQEVQPGFDRLLKPLAHLEDVLKGAHIHHIQVCRHTRARMMIAAELLLLTSRKFIDGCMMPCCQVAHEAFLCGRNQELMRRHCSAATLLLIWSFDCQCAIVLLPRELINAIVDRVFDWTEKEVDEFVLFCLRRL